MFIDKLKMFKKNVYLQVQFFNLMKFINSECTVIDTPITNEWGSAKALLSLKFYVVVMFGAFFVVQLASIIDN